MQTPEEGSLGLCGSVCVCTCVFMYVTVSTVHLHVLFISHPVIHACSLFQDSPASSFSQRFPPGNALDFPHLSSMFKCTVIQSPQDSAKKWALLLSNPPCFICDNSIWDYRLSRVLFCKGPFTARGPVPILTSGTTENPGLCGRQAQQWKSNRSRCCPIKVCAPFSAQWAVLALASDCRYAFSMQISSHTSCFYKKHKTPLVGGW